ncbi:MAG: hypothetical protein KME25_02590 [Symplocastrum torsivum CPER-KK1]|jgi:hypothetical protein|uniref:Uncharacterized protein n=1 Tax=Symplocastrum torsivum CPER-KK1 TaxID=450513 RepID=A0A951PGH3_9CYAN|nr:hypothetical protein [Symplocastrum torsivum CPER-KK1]
MLQTATDTKKESQVLLSYLIFEVDNIFFNLRKADKLIRRELNLLKQKKSCLLKQTLITPINEGKLKVIIENMPPQYLLMDEHIAYMLQDDDNSLFKLIRDYNSYLDIRNNEQEDNNYTGLIALDEKLVHHIRYLGAMTYHLNIHLNLLTVLLKNASIQEEP